LCKEEDVYAGADIQIPGRDSPSIALLSEGVSGLEAALLVTAFISGIGVGKLRPSLRFYRKYQGR
jgi:hypothetical protein